MAPARSNDQSEVTDFVVVKRGSGVKDLADTGLDRLPKQYIQPVEARMDMTTVVKEESIPIIDMSRYGSDSSVAELICDAAETWGFFQIINHNVGRQVLMNVQEATHGFFGSSAEEKNKYSKENSPTTNVRYGTSFSPQAEKSLEWKDYLSMFYTSEQEASAFWPDQCKDQVMEYMKQSEEVVKQLLEALMKKLNVKEIDETKSSLLMGSKRINLNYYPVCPNPELTVGIGPHSDVSTLTVLLQDGSGGLYVRGISGDTWVHVHPVEGSLVINVGDALQIMSNGRYKSVEHRVAANRSSNRISIPIFVNPRPNDIIGPLPEIIQTGQQPLYRQLVYSDYVRHFFKKAHDGKKTIDFAKITI